MKLDHEYFKVYLHRLSDYDSKKCHEICVRDQISEHLLTVCQYFKKKQSELKNQLRSVNLLYTAKMLFTIQEEIKAVLQFLKKTKMLHSNNIIIKMLKLELVLVDIRVSIQLFNSNLRL